MASRQNYLPTMDDSSQVMHSKSLRPIGILFTSSQVSDIRNQMDRRRGVFRRLRTCSEKLMNLEVTSTQVL